jgi:hypothetical protein
MDYNKFAHPFLMGGLLDTFFSMNAQKSCFVNIFVVYNTTRKKLGAIPTHLGSFTPFFVFYNENAQSIREREEQG